MVDVRVGSWRELGGRCAADPHPGVHRRAEDSRPRWNGTTPTTTRSTRSPTTASAARSATGRMLEHVPGVAKIGRMAVAASSRHGGVGRAVLEALLDAARSARRARGGAACAAQRRAVLRARRLRAPRAGVRRGRHRPRRDAARALSARRSLSLDATSTNASTWRGPSMSASQRRALPLRSPLRVAASMPTRPRLRRQRIGLHPGLRRRRRRRGRSRRACSPGGRGASGRCIASDRGACRGGVRVADAVVDEQLAHGAARAGGQASARRRAAPGRAAQRDAAPGRRRCPGAARRRRARRGAPRPARCRRAARDAARRWPRCPAGCARVAADEHVLPGGWQRRRRRTGRCAA